MLGKSPEGQLIFKAEVFSVSGEQWIRFTLKDDGQGIHPEKIKTKLKTVHPEMDLTDHNDHDIIQHVFDAGLSTRDEVGEFSGRGIGMNAIKDEAENLGGRAFVESEPPNGSLLTVEIPIMSNSNVQKQAA